MLFLKLGLYVYIVGGRGHLICVCDFSPSWERVCPSLERHGLGQGCCACKCCFREYRGYLGDIQTCIHRLKAGDAETEQQLNANQGRILLDTYQEAKVTTMSERKQNCVIIESCRSMSCPLGHPTWIETPYIGPVLHSNPQSVFSYFQCLTWTLHTWKTLHTLEKMFLYLLNDTSINYICWGRLLCDWIESTSCVRK